ncbi:hypothetical protein KY495_06595 [Massilia sp. PAMC28688]|uniref:IS66 family insertion sequence element accessory protein TnpA n=1 Tax=Massilia sp. PAMC28688 TaxID=2861283 RepID=UPI001C62A0E5|nr:hypothetical protein [Massilia sp. PAMC28688]QYF94848.1 hypothetical protein KY495_06595 [Massilia sp. PAMC28688]
MANDEREQLWRDRIAQLQASGMTQRAYAVEHGYSEHQVGYWVRRITKPAAPIAVATDLHDLSAMPIVLLTKWLSSIVPDESDKYVLGGSTIASAVRR